VKALERIDLIRHSKRYQQEGRSNSVEEEVVARGLDAEREESGENGREASSKDISTKKKGGVGKKRRRGEGADQAKRARERTKRKSSIAEEQKKK